MFRTSDAQLIRIFVGENDKYHSTPLYEAIVNIARRHDIAGATVLQGVMGYQGRGVIHTAKILRLTEQLPVVVEIVDVKEKVDPFLDEIADIEGVGLVTFETVRVLAGRKKKD